MRYINVSETIPQTEKEITQIKKELSLIEQAKKDKNYIDISNRSINNADEPLIKYLDEMVLSGKPVSEYNKLIALPASTRWLKDIFSSLNVNLNTGLSPSTKTKVLEHVRSLIRK